MLNVIVVKIFLEAGIHGRLPFTLEDASRPEADFEKEDAQFNKVLLDTRLNNRVLDLRVSGFISFL